FEDQGELPVFDVVGAEVSFHDAAALDHPDGGRAGVFQDDRPRGERKDPAAGERAEHRRHKEPTAAQARRRAETGDVEVDFIAGADAVAGNVRGDTYQRHVGDIGQFDG